MPTYTYLCELPIEEGGHGEFDEFHSIRDDAKLTECISCRKEKDISTPVHRQISGGSGKGIVELTGQDMVAKAKADGEAYKKEVYGSEKLYANVLSESKYENLQRKIDKQRR